MQPHLEVQVEEPSMEVALDLVLPRLVQGRATWRIANFRSKQRLLRQLPARLKAYARRLDAEPHLRIVVLADQDRGDCVALKARLDALAHDARLVTKSAAAVGARFVVLNRIVVRELESWLLGDLPALRACFPRLPATLCRHRGMHDPDAIANAWETLHRHLQKARELGEVYPKIDVARRVATHLDPARNRSRSFQMLVRGIEALLVP